MSKKITKDNPKRWFLIYNNDESELGFVSFGYVGKVNKVELVTGQPNLLSCLTEDELEVYLDKIAGLGYYKKAVESESNKFQGPSDKYKTINKGDDGYTEEL